MALQHLRQHHYFLLITRQPNAFRTGSAVGVMGDWSESSCPASRRASSDLLLLTSLKWRLDKQHTRAFDLDAGRNVEYEPEMTSQARSVERMNHKDLNVSVLGPHVCRDPSDYARATGSAPRTVTHICHVWIFVYLLKLARLLHCKKDINSSSP